GDGGRDRRRRRGRPPVRPAHERPRRDQRRRRVRHALPRPRPLRLHPVLHDGRRGRGLRHARRPPPRRPRAPPRGDPGGSGHRRPVRLRDPLGELAPRPRGEGARLLPRARRAPPGRGPHVRRARRRPRGPRRPPRARGGEGRRRGDRRGDVGRTAGPARVGAGGGPPPGRRDPRLRRARAGRDAARGARGREPRRRRPRRAGRDRRRPARRGRRPRPVRPRGGRRVRAVRAARLPGPPAAVGRDRVPDGGALRPGTGRVGPATPDAAPAHPRARAERVIAGVTAGVIFPWFAGRSSARWPSSVAQARRRPTPPARSPERGRASDTTRGTFVCTSSGTIRTVNGIRTALGVSGLVSAILGVLILVWPGRTAMVVTAIVAAYAVIAGLIHLGIGIFSGGRGGWARVGRTLLGVVFVVGGILAFLNLGQTTTYLAEFLGILVGVLWIVEGVVDLPSLRDAASKPVSILFAVLSIVAGVVLLLTPLWGATMLWWLLGLSLVVLGLVNIVRGFRYGTGPGVGVAR